MRGALVRAVSGVLLAVGLLHGTTGSAIRPDRSGSEEAVAAVRSAVRVLTATDERTEGAQWAWPLPWHRVLRSFDPPTERWGPGHRGIDVLGTVGSPVTAVEDGVVAYSGVIAGVGVVSVQHPDGLRSTYQPVDDRPARGTWVRRGEPVGTLASGGHCLLVSCLHLGALRGRDHYVDPLLLLGSWRLALLDPH